MPRRNRRQGTGPVEPVTRGGPGGTARSAGPRGDGDDYLSRPVPGGRAVKPYRCPGCDQLIPVGTPHVVAWPDRPGGDGERRHWHTGCWRGRHNRQPTRRRG